MAFISKKLISKKRRYYLEKSVRLPGGRIKKYSIYLKKYSPKKTYVELKDYKERLNKQINEEIINLALKYYKKDYIFNNEIIKKLEETKLGYKEITKKLTKKQLKDIIDRFTVNFTYESNAIEGNSLTLKDVNIVLQEQRIIKNKDLREVYETLNTRKALELIFYNKLKINQKDIIKLHSILTANTDINKGYKKIPNFLLGRNIKTTPPELVEKEMNSLIEWYKKNKKLHPLERASIFHGKFEKIHPFEDGNGRVGRLLINIILLTNGYSPLIIRKTYRISYFNALESFDNNHQDKLKRFLIEKYKDTYEKFFKVYITYLK